MGLMPGISDGSSLQRGAVSGEIWRVEGARIARLSKDDGEDL